MLLFYYWHCCARRETAHLQTHWLLPGHSGSAPVCAPNRLGMNKKREKISPFIYSVPAIRHSWAKRRRKYLVVVSRYSSPRLWSFRCVVPDLTATAALLLQPMKRFWWHWDHLLLSSGKDGREINIGVMHVGTATEGNPTNTKPFRV